MKLTAEMTAVDAARQVLPRSAEKFFKRGRKALQKGDAETLHEFRISAKRFRYALEIFQPLYGPQFRKKLSQLKKLQDLLGRLNDLATARVVLENRPGAVPLTNFLDREEKEVREKFETYWKEQMDAADSEARWIRYLTQYAGQRGRSTVTRPASE
jgi:CHAD domain-containing protein